MEIEVTALLAAAFPNNVKCPRCLRWHGVRYNTNWPVDSLKGDVPEERQIICDRCSNVLVKDFPTHDVSKAIRANMDWQVKTRPWNNDNHK